MFNVIKKWFQKYFSEPQSAILLIVLILGLLIIIFLGKILAPVFAALAVAYLLNIVIRVMTRCMKFPRYLSFLIVYLIFIGLIVVFLVVLLPMLSREMAQFFAELPNIMKAFHQFLLTLPQQHPSLISNSAINDIISSTQYGPDKFAKLTKTVFSVSLASLPTLITIAVYLFLVPFMVLFFLKDKDKLLAWFMQYVPRERGLVVQVWDEMRKQISNYVRGKFVEVIIVGVCTYVGFWFFNLNYSFLLATLVGLSVLVPYVGIVLASVPVIIVGLLQYGASGEFTWMLLVYIIIQALDGNVLVPLLFSEANNLHPVAIIIAVLFFGGIWGFWGVFFAIPLAALVRAAVNAWIAHAVVKPMSTTGKGGRRVAGTGS